MTDRNAPDLRLIDAAGLSGCVLLTVLAYTLVIGPTLSAAGQRARQREELAEKNRAASEAARAEALVERELEEARAKIDAVATTLRPAGDVNRQTAAIGDIAARQGFTVDEVQVGRLVPGDEFHTLPIRVAGEGSFRQTVRFLHGLHSELPGVAVSSFDMTGNPARADQPASVMINLAWYTAPPPSHQASAAP